MGKATMIGLAVVLTISAAACGGSGGGAVGIVNNSGNPPGLLAEFNQSGTGAAAELVQLAGVAAADQVNLSVSVGAPLSGDVRSFSFDLEIGNGAVLEYVDGSAAVGSGWSEPGSVTVQVSQQGDRIVVGVARLGSGGAAFSGGELLDLMLRVQTTGTSTLGFASSPAPTALDGSAQPVVSVQFDAQNALIQAL